LSADWSENLLAGGYEPDQLLVVLPTFTMSWAMTEGAKPGATW